MNSLAALVPLFSHACKEWEIELKMDPTCLIKYVVWSLPMNVNKGKCHQIYKHLAWALGWSEQWPFPNDIDQTIKAPGLPQERSSLGTRNKKESTTF